MKNAINRRQLLIGTAGALSVLALKQTGLAYAAAQVDPEEAQAKALQYAHASAKDGQTCANCQLYSGPDGDEWGPCAIFPGKVVNANGWCASWIKKNG